MPELMFNGLDPFAQPTTPKTSRPKGRNTSVSEERKGPWINASHAAIAQGSPDGQLLAVRCPGVLCQNRLITLDDGAIGTHNNPVDFGECTWSGVGIHDDREGAEPHDQRA